MALQSDTVSLGLAASLSQGSDDKQIDQSKLATSEEVRIVKDKRVQKRDGLQDFPTTQTSLTVTNPITIGTSQTVNMVEEFEGQKLLRNKGVLYAHNDATNVWEQKAYTPVLKVREQPVASSSYTVLWHDTISAFDTTITVTADRTTYRYSIFRNSDGVYLSKDVVFDTTPGTITGVRVVPMANTFAVLTSDSSLGSLARSVSPTTGVISAATSLGIGAILDAIFLPSAAPGATLVVLSVSSPTVTLYTFTTAFASRAITVSLGAFVFQSSYLYNLASNSNRVFGFSMTATVMQNWVYDLGVSAWTTILAPTTRRTLDNNPLAIAALVDAQNAFVINAFFTETKSGITHEEATYVQAYNLNGTTASLMNLWSYGLSIAGAPFNDTERQTTLVPVAYYGVNQPFAGIADYHRQREQIKPSAPSEPRAYLTAKMGLGRITLPTSQVSGATRNNGVNVLPRRPSRSWTTAKGFAFSYPAIQRYISIDKNEADVGADVSYVELENNTSSHLRNNRTFLLAGQQTWAYDGADVGEHGFSFVPPRPYLSLGQPLQDLTVTVTGTASLRQVITVKMGNGAAFLPDAVLGESSYLRFYTPTGANDYHVWFTLDGGNIAPTVPGSLPIPVALFSTDSYEDVLRKTAQAITTAAPGVAQGAYDALLRTLTVSNNAVGVVGAPVVVAYDRGGPTTLPAGTYQAVVLYSYIDKNGAKFRSAPSLASTVTIAAPGINFACVFAVPDITNREYRLNGVEVYMTEANGSVFYWLSSNAPNSRVIWTGAAARLVYKQDLTSPNIFTFPYSSNEQLYTTGDVLENDYPTGWDKVTNYKGRVVVGFPNAQKLIYSKTPASDEGLAFSDFLQILADQDDDPVGAIGELDDKLIVFKDRRKYAVVGEPANDAGSGSSLSLPTLISSDKGCREPQSLIQTSAGLFYRSLNGIYLLGRDLSDKYIGSDAQDSNPFTLSKGVLLANSNEIVYFFSNSPKAYTFNFEFDIWTIWRNHQATFGSNGSRMRLVRADGRVLEAVPGTFKDVENSVSTAVTYEIEMPWLKIKGQQDYFRCRAFMILGDYKSPHDIQVDIWWDYDKRDAVKQTLTRSSADIINGTGYADGTYQAKFQPMIQKCEAIKIRIRDIPVSVNNAESCTLNAIDFEVAMKKGQDKFKAAKKV